MVDAAGTTTYSYTTAGRMFTEDWPWASDTVTNWYRNGLRTNLSLGQPTGVWTNELGYDAAKRLTSVTSPAGSFTYTLGGAGYASPLVKKLALPNTSYVTNTFDTVARLLGTWLKNSTNGTLDSAAYAYNTGNQRTTFTNAAGTFLGYTYDPIGQLKVADSSVNTEDRGYGYDAAWNVSQRTNNVVVWSYSYNSKNELTVVGNGWDCSYDGNGNRTYEQNSGHSFELYMPTNARDVPRK